MVFCKEITKQSDGRVCSGEWQSSKDGIFLIISCEYGVLASLEMT
jgi:hypothetical protein